MESLFLDNGKGEIQRFDASVLLQNKGFPVTREALMSKAKECTRNSNIPFKAIRGWCEKFMK
jgi:hypothetical protein